MSKTVNQFNKSKEAVKAKETLLSIARKVDEKLEVYLVSEIQNAFGVSEKEKKLSRLILSHLKEHNLRSAKRLRAAFVIFGHKLLKTPSSEIMKAAVCVELIHSGLLMMDDFMDQDELRRGKPTTHIFFKNFHQKEFKRGDSLHYGESFASNTGLLAVCMGLEVLGKSRFEESKKNEALNRLYRGVVNTTLGQAFDLSLESGEMAEEQDILDLHHAKTAIYTYENPLHVGAVLAGANENDLGLLSRYAIAGGIAFQLQDDILGLFGDTAKTGKPNNSDLRQGKMTLLIIKALEMGNQNQIETINKYWGKNDITEKQAEEVRKVVIDTGSLEYSKQISIGLAKKAQLAVTDMYKKGWDKEAIEFLNGIAQYMVERDL
jgi:geranylgeranyl diphosphate synthase, type I